MPYQKKVHLLRQNYLITTLFGTVNEENANLSSLQEEISFHSKIKSLQLEWLKM